MNIRAILASIALSVASTGAFASTCANWGSLGPPGLETFGNSFSAVGNYTDCYTFGLSAPSNSFGLNLSLDTPLNSLNIGVTTEILNASGAVIATDSTPGFFSFSNLAAGTYTLAILSDVTGGGLALVNTPVGYAGFITTLAAPAPEPGIVTLMLAGFLGLGMAVWRRRGS
jgi:hypothetical protein